MQQADFQLIVRVIDGPITHQPGAVLRLEVAADGLPAHPIYRARAKPWKNQIADEVLEAALMTTKTAKK